MTSNSNEYLCTLLKRNKSYDHFSLLTTKKNKTNSFILNTKETLHSISKLRYKLKKTNYNHNEKEIHSKKMSYLDISKPNILTSKSNKNSKSFSYLPIKKSQPLNQLSDKINTKNKSYLSNKNSQLYLYKINKDSSINYSVSTNLERSFSNKSINSSRRILKENFDNYKCQEFNLIKFFNNENVLDSQFLYEKIFDEKTNIYKKLINSISLLEKQKNLLEIEIEKYEKSSSENSNESVKIDFIKRRLESQSKFNHQEIIKIREESIKYNKELIRKLNYFSNIEETKKLEEDNIIQIKNEINKWQDKIYKIKKEKKDIKDEILKVKRNIKKTKII